MNSQHNKIVGLAPIVIVAFLALSAQGQITTGAITGRVIDASGAVVPSVSVELINAGTQATRSTTTNEAGEYTFVLLPLGTYRIQIKAPGFQTIARPDIQIRVNEITRVDLMLQPGTVQEVVEVTGTPSPMQTETGEVGGVVDRQAVDQLPLNGRNFLQLIALQPGGVSTGKLPGGDLSLFTSVFQGNYSVHGAPAESTNYLLDGVDMRDVVDTRLGFLVTVDAIQEFKFQAANYSAAFGRASGGQINIASRSGSNRLHGSVWEFLRNDKLDARNFFDTVKPPFRQNQFGASLGGPIRKDKTFFFGSYEGFRQRKGVSRLTAVPTLKERSGDFSEGPPIFNPLEVDSVTGQRRPFADNRIPSSLFSPVGAKAMQLYPLPNRPGRGTNLAGSATQSINTDQVNVRIDHRLRSSDVLFGRLTYVRVDRLIPFLTTTLPNFITVYNSPARNAVLGDTHTFGPHTVNEFRLGYNRHTQVG